MKKVYFITTRTIIFIAVVAIALCSICISFRISVTALKLLGISQDIREMEVDAEMGYHHWGPDIQKMYDNDIADRNALINSDNPIVSTFASHGHFVRLIMFASAIITVILSCSLAKKSAYEYKKMLSKFFA